MLKLCKVVSRLKVCFGMEDTQDKWKRQILNEYVYYPIYVGGIKGDSLSHMFV